MCRMALLKCFVLCLLKWMTIRSLLDCLKNSFVDTEKNGSGENQERQICEHANQTEIGQ